jgi:hypothetical protein
MSHGLIVVPRSLRMFQRERRSNTFFISSFSISQFSLADARDSCITARFRFNEICLLRRHAHEPHRLAQAAQSRRVLDDLAPGQRLAGFRVA